MASRSQQSNETKQVIAKYKKLMDKVETEKEKMILVKEATSQILDSIQKIKVSKSLVDYM